MKNIVASQILAAALLVGSSANAYVCTLSAQGAVKYQNISLDACRTNPNELCVEGTLKHTSATQIDHLKARPDACSALVCQMAGTNVDVGLYFYQSGNKAYVFNHGTQRLLATCE